MVKIVAPNTNLNPSLLSKNIILCCGEDSNELINSFKELTSDNLEKFHEFRCYKFWKFPDLSLIWTGIGTGVLEPLLWEIFLNEETGKIGPCVAGGQKTALSV